MANGGKARICIVVGPAPLWSGDELYGVSQEVLRQWRWAEPNSLSSDNHALRPTNGPLYDTIGRHKIVTPADAFLGGQALRARLEKRRAFQPHPTQTVDALSTPLRNPRERDDETCEDKGVYHARQIAPPSGSYGNDRPWPFDYLSDDGRGRLPETAPPWTARHCMAN